MSELSTEEIEALLEKATPGDWTATTEPGEGFPIAHTGEEWWIDSLNTSASELFNAPNTEPWPEADAKLIAAAPDLARTALHYSGRCAELEAILDGDPNQTETPETRRAWRRSAVRYADKCEKRIAELEAENIELQQHIVDIGDWDTEVLAAHVAELEAEVARLHAKAARWDVLKVELTNWIETDEPNSESQEAVFHVRHAIMPKVESKLAAALEEDNGG